LIRKFTALLLALMLALPLLALAETTTQAPDAQAETQPNYFASLVVQDIYGNAFDASVFDGKPALINIWSDWCGYCLEEMPALNKLAEVYKDRMTFVGLLLEGATVAADGEWKLVQDKLDAAIQVVEARGVTYPTIVPDMSLLYHLHASDLRLQGYPTTWFIGADGMIYHVEVSAHSEEGWISLIDQVLAYMEEQGVAVAP